MSDRAIACLLGPEFEDLEFRIPYDRLVSEGYDVEIIGKQAGEHLDGKRGKERVKADRGIDRLDLDAYDLLLIPGGNSPDRLRADARFVDLVREFDRAHKLIAAVCHGAQLFLSAGIQKGRTLTAWSTVQEDLRQAGAVVRDEPVVEDANWITSRKPDDLQAFSDAIVRRLEALTAPRLGPPHSAQQAGA